MDDKKIVKMYNELFSGEREVIKFNSGYKIFEEYYEKFKQYGLKREEVKQLGWTEVVISVK